jgi:hypothetical protein
MNGGIINYITRLHLVGYFYWVILRCTDPWKLKIVTVLNDLFRISGLILVPHIHTNPFIHLVFHIVISDFLWIKSELAILHVGMAWETVYSLLKSQVHVYRFNTHFFLRTGADITCLLHAAASFMFLFTASPIHAFASFKPPKFPQKILRQKK